MRRAPCPRSRGRRRNGSCRPGSSRTSGPDAAWTRQSPEVVPTLAPLSSSTESYNPAAYSRCMPQIHQERRRRAQGMVRELDADAVLVTAAPNVRYLTGLASSNAALLLPADGEGLLATDSRYALAAERDAPDLELLTERFIEERLAAEAARRGVRTLAFEAHEMTVERHAEVAARAG